MTRGKVKNNSNDLASLESSLTAVEESTNAIIDQFHPSWVYYYLSFLLLFLTAAFLLVINFSMRLEEPSFLSLNESKVRTSETREEIKIPTGEQSSENVISEHSKTASTPYDYHFYTPEDLQKIADKISSNSSEDLNIVKAEVLSFLGWYDGLSRLKKEGMDFANRCIQANSQDPRAQRALALAYLANGQNERSRVILSGLHPTSQDSLKDWMDGYLLLSAGRAQAATTKFEQIRKADPSFYPASYMLIQQYLKLNLVSQANDVAQFWKAKGLNNLAFVRLMAEILDRQQQYIELEYFLNPFESAYAKDWTVLYYLGKGNAKLQKRDLAKTYFKKILDAQENYTVDQIGKTYFEFGKLVYAENNFKNSIEYFFEASQRIPNDPNTRFYLASAYFKSEDYEKAIDIYQQMLLKDQNDPKIRIYLGMAYFELGQFQSSEKNLQLVLNQGSNEPLLLYYLAKVEEQKGDHTKAREYLQKILDVEPKYPQAVKMMEKLGSPTAPAAPTQTQP